MSQRPAWVASASLLAAFLVVVLGVATQAKAQGSTVMVAVGSNRSLDKRLPTLRYAETDADKFAVTAARVGLIDVDAPVEEAMRVDRNVTLRQFTERLDAAAAEAPAAGKAWRFVLYFSGHADDRGLHFADGFLSRERLHALLGRINATTKVIVLDSCFAGAIATKGVEAAPAFDLPRLDLDELSGTVFLTASSSRELAYESDELGGSVFTHFLVLGLSGRGDGNGDGLVTIDELYQYVYREMRLRGIMAPGSVAQKPEIHADLRGAGALVVARPRVGRGSLYLDPGIMGTVRVASLTGLWTFDAATDGLHAHEMALPEGSYRAVVRRGNRIGQATFHVKRDAGAQLYASDFTWKDMDGGPIASKGGMFGALGLTGMLAARYAADRAQTRGPQVEFVSELDRFDGNALAGRAVLIRSLHQASGAAADAGVESYGIGAALALIVGPTYGFDPQVLIGFGQGFEMQRWTYGDRRRDLSVVHPSVLTGISFKLGPEATARRLALRYDADYFKDLESRGMRRRDIYLLGVTFDP